MKSNRTCHTSDFGRLVEILFDYSTHRTGPLCIPVSPSSMGLNSSWWKSTLQFFFYQGLSSSGKCPLLFKKLGTADTFKCLIDSWFGERFPSQRLRWLVYAGHLQSSIRLFRPVQTNSHTMGICLRSICPSLFMLWKSLQVFISSDS